MTPVSPLKSKTLCIGILMLFLCCAHTMRAQTGYITTIAGNGSSGFSGDGGAATTATMGQALGVAVDATGNVYIPDDANNRLRKVNPSGIITTVAGGGSSTADGVPATNAQLSMGAQGVCAVDAAGNIYIKSGARVRKITVATGIITTVAGTGTIGYSGDGGAATAAQIAEVAGVNTDPAGNIYISGGNVVRKVNTAGIISTFAGTGTGGFNGDGLQATATMLNLPSGVCTDAAGNVYIAENYNYRIRKITTAGIVSTYAGNGSGGFSGDGGPATAAKLSEPSRICIDAAGNMYIADFHNSRVRMVTPSGMITTFAGGGTSLLSGVPATSASFSDVWGIGIDNFNNIYIADRNHYRICRVGHGIPVAFSDSFNVYADNLCAGPQISVLAAGTSTAYNQVTSFGDGLSYSSPLTVSSAGYDAVFTHAYALPGTYTIKTILLNGTTIVDSVSFSYQYKMCNVLEGKFYIDNNGTGNYEPSLDELNRYTVKVAIDSNGTPVDTISATSGFYYTAYGTPGDVYTVRVISTIAGLSVTSPASGFINNTLSSSVYAAGTNYFGMTCNSVPGNNLRIRSANRCGSHQYGGELLVDNLYCTASTTPSIVTLRISPKYLYQSAIPTPSSVSGNTLTWDLTGVSSTGVPVHISISGERPYSSSSYLPGDTVHSHGIISPFIGDTDTTDNHTDPVDTVKSGYDPNFIDVSPSGYIPSGTRLQYTIGFENTGNDTAFNIYILDTLSDDLDPATLEIVTASAAMDIYTFHAGGHTIVKFDFPHINLLDSSHHNLCNGMVIYTIKTRNGLPDCRHIPNRAGIYFDDNPVVMTNTIENIIGPAPAAALLSGSNAVCPGSSITLTTSVAGGTWSAGNSNATVTGGIVNGISAGPVFIYYTLPAVCDPVTSQYLITVGAPISASISAPPAICLGSSVTVSASVPGGSWSHFNSNTSLSGSTVAGVHPGIDTIYYTITSSCGSATNAYAIRIDTVAIPPAISGVATLCPGTTAVLANAMPGGTWSFSNANATISSTGLLNGVTSGAGTAYYTVTNSCGSHASSLAITVLSAAACGSTAGTPVYEDQTVQVFPNPTGDHLTIMTANEKYQSATITNQLGQVVFQQLLTGNITNADLKHLPKGLYYLALRGATCNKTILVVKI